ncbi:MAG TPA: nitroreductase family protein [Acidimicrobiia bacterium]|nr:nitroreductase family protein [Acidimicrobiia bacterium]
METFDAIRSRRNVRSYESRAIDPAAITRILEAGRRTPSSRNEQRWDFVVVTEPERLERLSHVWRGAGHIAGSAATIALIAPEADEERVRTSIAYDLGQATMSIMLAAADLGVGSGHSSCHDQDVAREVLGFPDGYTCAWLIGLGYPSDRPLRPIERPNRRPLDEVVHREVW